MKLQGERTIPASVERTWIALNDPETLKACIPGCESIETTGENQYLATMAIRIGPVNARFKGRLQLADIVPLVSYRILFDGQGGVAGFGKGSADVRLTEEAGGDATRLAYAADAQIGGKIAQVGSRLVESAAAKIADEFFKAFETRMTAVPAAAAPPEPPVAVSGAADTAGTTDATTAMAGTGTPGAPAGAPAGTAPAGTATAAPAAPTAGPSRSDRPAPAAAAAGSGGDGGNRIWLWAAAALVVAIIVYYFER